jgi:hypothetical protein
VNNKSRYRQVICFFSKTYRLFLVPITGWHGSGVMFTTHLYLVTRLRMSGAILPLSLRTFMECKGAALFLLSTYKQLIILAEKLNSSAEIWSLIIVITATCRHHLPHYCSPCNFVPFMLNVIHFCALICTEILGQSTSKCISQSH